MLPREISKLIPWMTILTVCLMVGFGGVLVLKEVGATGVSSLARIGNAPPSAIAAITLNGGIAIIVVGNSTTTIYGSTTVTDGNGGEDITSATATLFHNATATCNSGTLDPNWCYYDGSCIMGVTTSNSRVVTCSADVWFVGEPTAGTGSVAGPGDWQMDITATDGAGNPISATSGANSVELDALYYFAITSSINYGSTNPGATSSEATTTATNQGNSPIDLELSGVDMEDNGNTIIPDQQHYGSASLGDWGGTALTSTVANIDLDLAKPTATTSDSYDDIYWMIKIPDTQAPGTYSGTNTVSAIDAAPFPFCGWASHYNSTSTVSGDLVYCDNSGRLWTPTAIIGGAATTSAWGGYGIDEDPDSCINVDDRPACNYCDDLNYAGYTDGWELPTCVDDDTLPASCVLYQFGVDNCSWDGGDGGQSSCQPSWDTNAQANLYWSSTEYDSNLAWSVNFNNGVVNDLSKNTTLYVRCVRGQ